MSCVMHLSYCKEKSFAKWSNNALSTCVDQCDGEVQTSSSAAKLCTQLLELNFDDVKKIDTDNMPDDTGRSIMCAGD